MAVLSLNTNLPSLQTQRRLAQSTSSLSESFERLSSGLRVSRASDDAAGLAIASGLNVDSRVFSQGVRNLSDGVSLTNIAEGALNELTNIVTRLQELSEQAANGTLGIKQRAALDAEAQALSKEYFRIAKTTEFNGLKLFDGSIQGLTLQGSYGASGSLRTSLGGKLGTGNLTTQVNFEPGLGPSAVALGDLNGDGVLDLVSANYGGNNASVLLGNHDGTFMAKTDFTTGGTPAAMALGDLNNDGVLDLACANRADGTASVLIGNGDGSFKAKTDFATGASVLAIAFGDLNQDGTLDIVSSRSGAASVLLGNGDGSFKAKADFTTTGVSKDVSIGDLNRDGILDIVAANIDVASQNVTVLIGNGNGTFKTGVNYAAGGQAASVALGDVNGDGSLDIVTANYQVNSLSVLSGNGDGTFKNKADFAAGSIVRDVALGDLNGDGSLDLVSANYGAGSLSLFLGNGDGTLKAKTDFALLTESDPDSIIFGDLNADGVLDLVSASSGNNHVSVILGETRDGVSPLLDFSLKTKADAKWALELMKQKLTQLSQQRGITGANQSRLTTAAANLQVERENYKAASSQIIDVDVASESSQLLKTQILQQAASVVLSQANQAPALALKLLQG